MGIAHPRMRSDVYFVLHVYARAVLSQHCKHTDVLVQRRTPSLNIPLNGVQAFRTHFIMYYWFSPYKADQSVFK